MNTLVIVARDRPELYEQLVNRYGRLSHVRVMLDRRRAAAAPVEGERRRDDEVNEGLSTRGYVAAPGQ
jgi:hypothetical protein